MKKKPIVISCLLLTTLMLSGCGSAGVTGDSLINGDRDHLIVQGSIETKEVDINSKIAGKVSQIKVSEGDKVKKGDILFIIDSDTIQTKKAQAQAAMEAAKGQVKAAEAAKQAALAQAEKAQNGTRSQELAQAKVAYELAQKTYNRVKSLYESSACSQSTFDEASTKYEIAKETYDEAKQGARSEDKSAANAVVAQAESSIEAYKGQLQQAQGALDEVDTYLEDTVIKAPIDGTVTEINVEAGELISTGMPLTTVSNIDKPWAEVNVKETDLSMVKLGEGVTVSLQAYPKEKFKGKIIQVNEKPAFATKRATNNNGEFDVLSFGVKVELEDIKNKVIYPGMTAIVDFGKKEAQ